MNKNHEFNQCIFCGVASCVHNDREGTCSLGSIKVLPCPHCKTGDKARESMCGSYEAE